MPAQVTYTVAYWQANQSTLDAGAGFTITDTASNISAAFDALDLDTHITQLIISDNAAVTVSTNQLFVSDTNAISLLKNANNSAYTLVVSDTGANITTYLNNLQTNTHVTTIVVASGTVDATVAQLASDSTALANLKTSVGGPQASITVNDTSAHLHSGWANVAADSQVSSIVISDNTQLTLTATQASQTSSVEKLVYGNSTTSDIVLVKDTAAHIEADLGSLETVSSFIQTVTVSDSTFETLSASQVTNDLAILSKITFQSGPATFNVSDSSAAVSANLDALQSLSGSISSIAVTDNSPITVSIAQLADDTNALSLITYNSNPISVAVADTGINISGNLATLEAAIEAASPPITSISVTSGVINTTVTQLTNDSAVFAALTGTFTLNVSDTASNISGALDTLQTFAHNGDISAINVTDSGNIAVTVAQITSDAAAISELVDNDTNPYTLAVTDTAAHIQTAFSSLGSNAHIASVTFTDATPVLTITASQFISGATVLGEITNASFTIDVTGASAAQAATIATDFAGLPDKADATLSIAVSDTAANISSHLVALGANTYVATIAIGDSNPLSLTEGQYTGAGHDAGLAKMIGAYTVDVTGVTVAEVSTVEGISGLGGTPTLSIAVSDVAANITSAALTSLGGDSNVTSIAVGDSNPLTLTEAQFTGDAAGLAKMTGSYTVDISGVSVAQVSAVEAVTLGGTPTLSIAVSDAGGNFTGAALQTLGADNDVTSIAVTSSIVSLNVTPFTNAADDAGFAKFVGAYTVQVLGATVAQVATVEAVSLPGTPTLQIWVSDSGTNLTDSALRTLGADSKVTLILVSDSNPITLTEAQFTGGPEHAGLAKLSGSYTVDVTGATVAQVSTVEGVFLPGSATLSIAVSDAAATIAANLSTLGSDSSVTSIAVNDSNPITLTESAFTADSAGLGKMTGSYTVDVTGVTVAQVSTVEGASLGGTPTLSIAVSDAASAVSPALATLGSDIHVVSIALTGGTITITEANYTSAGYDAGLAKMTGSYIVDVQGVTVAQISAVEAVTGLGGAPTVGMDIRDTGANVSAALVSLGSDSKVSDIILASGIITLTEAQYTNSGDQAGLAKMLGAYNVNVTGVTVAQVATVEGVIIGGSGTPTLSIAVSDTGTNLTAPKLISLGSDSKVASIAVTSGALTLTATQFTTAGEDAGLAKMAGAYTVNVTNAGVAAVATVEAVHLGGTPTLSIAVSDIGSRITSARLVSFGSDSKVTSITDTSGAIVLTEAQFVADHAGLAKMIGSYTVDVTGVSVAQLATVEGASLPGTPTLSIAVVDTGANLSNFEMATLSSDSHVASIAVTSGAMTFNESQFTAGATAFGKMTGTYTVDVSGVTVAQVPTVEGVTLAGTPTLAISVSDSAANITSAALVSLGGDSKVTSIAVSDGNPITLTESQFVADETGLAKMTGAYTVDVTGATVAQLSAVEDFNLPGTPTLNIAVADTAAHVGSAETSLNADSHVTSVSVSDTAANISTYIDDLAGVTNLTSVVVNDYGILSITYAQLTSDQHAFNVMTESGYPHFYYNVVGATVAQGVDVIDNRTNYISAAKGYFENLYLTDNAANVANGSIIAIANAAGIQINDTAADVSTSLNALEAQMPNIRGLAITLSDPTDNLVVTEAQLTSDKSVLAAINNGTFDIAVTNVLAADVPNIPADVTSANSHASLTSISVTDTAANYAANLSGINYNDSDVSLITSEYVVDTTAGLEANFSILNNLMHLAGITFTDPGTPLLTIDVVDVGSYLAKVTNASWDIALTYMNAETAAQGSAYDIFYYLHDGAGNPAGVTLTSILVTDSAGNISYWNTNYGDLLNQNTLITQVNVVDSAGNVAAYLGNLNGVDHLAISLTDPSDELSVTESAFVANLTALGAITNGSWNLEVTGLTIAQLATVEADEAALPNASHITFAESVADIAANITDAALQSLGSDSKVTSITVSDSNPITLTESQFTGAPENAGLAKMAGSYTVDVTGVTVALVGTVEGVTGLGGTPTLSIAVADTASNITDSVLQSLGADSKVTSIASTGGVIQLTEAQFTGANEVAGLAKMVGSYAITVGLVTYAEVATVEGESLGGTPTLTINVQDVGGNLTSSALSTLGADGKITNISVSSGTITLTEAQFTNSGVDAGFAKMNGSYTVAVTGVLVSQVAAVEAVPLNGSPTLHLSVTDGGGGLTAAQLTTLGADPDVTLISTLTTILLTEAQFTNSGVDAGLAKMSGSYALVVYNVSVAQVATVESQSGLGGTPSLTIAVSDTGANLTAPKLVSLGADSKVTSIAVTSGPITLTTSQFTTAGEDAGLAKMTGPYTVDVINVGVANVATVEAVTGLGGTPTLSIAVTDIGSRITSGQLVSLGADHHVTSIAVTSGAISLTETQFVATADHAGLAKLIGSYTVDVTGVTVAKVATVEAVSLPGTPTLSIAVTDTAADLTPALFSQLGADSKVASIAISSGTLLFSESQYTTSGVDAGLAKLAGSYAISVSGVSTAQVSTVEGITLGGTPTLSIGVSDIGSNFTSAELVSLGADSKVASITVTSGAIALTESQYLAGGDDNGLTKIVGSYTVDVSGVTVAQVSAVEAYHPGTITQSIAVSDSGSNITSAALVALGSDSKVTSIAVSDSNPITLTEAHFTNAGDDAGLAKMTGAYTVDVTGVSAAQVVTVENQTGLGGTPTILIAVSDNGSNLTSVELVSLGSNPNVSAITVTSGPITLTEAQFTNSNDLAGLAKMVGAYTVDVTGVTVAQLSTVEGVTGLGGTPTLSIAVTDVAANITASALQTIGAADNITSVTLTDSNPIVLTEAQFVNVSVDPGLAKMLGTYTIDVTGATAAQVATVEGVTGLGGTPTLSIAVSDTGAHLTGAVLSALGTDNDVTSIAVSSGAISVTANQFTSAGDTAAFAKMVGAYTVDVTTATVAQVATVEAVSLAGTPTLSIAVNDTGAHITSAALAGFGSDNDVTSIAVTSGAITLTEAQFTAAADDAGLAKMTGLYTVDVTGATAAQVAAVEAVTGLGGTPTLSISVNDIGGNLTAAALTSLGSDPDVTSIAVSSGAISLSEAQFTNANVDAGLDKVAGSFTVDVSGVQVSQIGTVEGVVLSSTPTLSIAVNDTGANLTDTALQALGTDNDVTSIFDSSGAITLTESQVTGGSEGEALAKMVGSYTVDVSGATVAEVATVEGVSYGGSDTLSISVVDTGGDITSAALVSLGSDHSVASITDSSGAITLTEAQYTASADIAGLAKMIGSYTIDVTGVHVAQISTVEGEHSDFGGTPTLSIAVSDTGANITDAALQSLGADGDIATIAVSSGSISLTEGEFTGAPENAGLEKMTGTYDVAVSGVSVAQVGTVEGVTVSGTANLSIAVTDIASDYSDAALQGLGTDGKVTSIAVASGVISLTESQFTGTDEDLAFAKMTGPYTVDVSGVSVAEITTVESVSLAGTPTLSIAVSDVGGALTSGSLVSMGSDSDVTSIAVTSGAITLTEAQFVANADVKGLEKITSGFTVDVTGVTAAQVATVTTDFGNLTNSGSGILNIAVSDTAGHVANNAPALNTNSAVTSVAVTDTAAHVVSELDILNGVEALNAITLTDPTPALALTESTFVGGLLALDTIQNTGVTMTVTATASQAATVASDFTGLTDDSHFTFTIAVADNAANVASNASALNSDPYASIHVTDNDANVIANILTLDTVSGLSAVTLTNATPALTLTAAQMEGAVNVLTDVTNSSISILVTDVSVAQLRPVVSAYFDVIEARQTNPFLSFSIAMSDTAANIEDGLGTNGQFRSGSNISSITVSDGQPLNFEYGYNYFPNLLSKLTGTETVNVTDVTGQAYSAFTNVYINGSIVETIDYNNDGSTTAVGTANGLTFTPAGPSAHPESINVTGYHLESFDFTGNFGNVSITGFNVNNDMMVFNSAEFSNVAAVELHTTQVNGNAVVTLDSGDTITIVGITAASFEAHSNDWSFSSFT